MPASPRPAPAKLTRKADRYIVLLGPEDGSTPTVEDECRWLVPVSATQSMGAERLDTIKCRVDFGRGGKRLQDTTNPVGFHRQLELRKLDEEGEPTEVVGWGMIAIDSQQVAMQDGETITARLDHFLFGGVLEETPYWDEINSAVRYVHLPAIINPTIDDVFEPNKSDRTHPDRGDSPLFYHPESHRLPGASTLQGQTAEEWSFKHVIHWLCWQLNEDETYVTNPTLDELEPAFATEAGFARIRNLHLKYGRTLPQLLDDLLTPFGYGWQRVYSLESDVRKTKLRFFERGKGPKVKLLMQPIGETINTRKTNVSQFSLDYDIAKLSNEIIGRGALELYEATFPLVPAWDPADDDTGIETLEVGQSNAISKKDVGRKFVLNEAGDYTDVRAWIDDRFNLDDILGEEHVIRRRRFRPCLSQHASGDDESSNGYVVEWWDEDQDDATDHDDPEDPGWVKVKHAHQPLEKECGVMFTGSTPPGEFLQKLVDETDPEVQPLFVRITCCIEGDRALSHRSTKRDSSPNGEIVPLFIDLHDRFKYRQVDSTSVFDGQTADERDDTDDIETFCDKVRDNNDQAEVSVSVTLLTDNHPEYKIGQLIEKVDGRNLTFNANSAAATPRQIQIIGITRTLDSERRTELLVESFELERRELQVTA